VVVSPVVVDIGKTTPVGVTAVEPVRGVLEICLFSSLSLQIVIKLSAVFYLAALEKIRDLL